VPIGCDGWSNQLLQVLDSVLINFSDKVKRLEALLTKCKESIKANKQKTTALTEVKESLATQLASKEAECNNLSSQLTQLQNDHEVLKKKEQEEELQVCFRLTLKLNYCAICIYWTEINFIVIFGSRYFHIFCKARRNILLASFLVYNKGSIHFRIHPVISWG